MNFVEGDDISIIEMIKLIEENQPELWVLFCREDEIFKIFGCYEDLKKYLDEHIDITFSDGPFNKSNIQDFIIDDLWDNNFELGKALDYFVKDQIDEKNVYLVK